MTFLLAENSSQRINDKGMHTMIQVENLSYGFPAKELYKKVYIDKKKVSLIEEDGTLTAYWSGDAYVYKIIWMRNPDLDELSAMARSVGRK